MTEEEGEMMNVRTFVGEGMNVFLSRADKLSRKSVFFSV